MKKEYELIEFEVIFLAQEDVVTASFEDAVDDPFGDWESKQ